MKKLILVLFVLWTGVITAQNTKYCFVNIYQAFEDGDSGAESRYIVSSVVKAKEGDDLKVRSEFQDALKARYPKVDVDFSNIHVKWASSEDEADRQRRLEIKEYKASVQEEPKYRKLLTVYFRYYGD